MQVYIISDRRLRPDLDLDRLIDLMAGAGADMMQIREKDLPAAAVLSSARRAVASGSSARVFVNARADLALASGAAGVHLPAAGVGPAGVRRLWGSRLAIGVSTHGLDEALDAMRGGADFITLGPVFDTESKRRYGPPLGVDLLRKVAAAVTLPVFAIGGIDRHRVAELRNVPIAGIAVISAVLKAADPAAAVAELRGALR